jgi:solute carrier family 20 (sodium-dependent phosphate transporter)
MQDPAMPEYLWLVVVGAFAAFAYGWATGANDVANAFGTSVGAKTLTLWQAVIIAAVFEFCGGVILGRVSTSTIANGIANTATFQEEPELYAYGMVCALIAGFIWQTWASIYEYNVSATHSIIGAIMGFALVYKGSDGVNWAQPNKDVFPPYRGVLPIVLSWFVSPVLTATASALMFFILRFLVLRRENSYGKAFWVLPPSVMLCTWICVYFVFTRGAKRQFEADGADWDNNKSAWVAAICAGGMGVLTVFPLIPFLKWKANKQFAENQKEAEEGGKDDANLVVEAPPVWAECHTMKDKIRFVWKKASYGLFYDCHKVIDEDPIVSKIHENAEQFDPKAEFAFSYLQVFSACCVIFSHGAGEVGYMAGPLTTINYVYRYGTLPSRVVAPLWSIFISAIALVIGLATYGYKVTRAVGVRMAKLSPTRGFCAELSTAMVIMIAAQYGLPTSSSQCITGGIIGVGLLEGKAGINWSYFGKLFISWILTLFFVAGVSAGLFAQGVYAPSISTNKTLRVYEKTVIAVGHAIYSDFNSTLFNYQNSVTNTSRANWDLLRAMTNNYTASGSAVPTNLTNQTWSNWRSQFNYQATLRSNRTRYSRYGTVTPQDNLAYLYKALSLLQNNTIVTLGQVNVFPGARVCNNATYNATTGVGNRLACRTPDYFRRMPPLPKWGNTSSEVIWAPRRGAGLPVPENLPPLL